MTKSNLSPCVHDEPAPHSLAFKILEEQLKTSTVIFPGSKAYADTTFIGNLLYQSQRPVIIVQATSIPDIVTTIAFCRANGYQLTLKSGGHSYAGYCLNEGGLVLDLSALNGVAHNPANDVVTIQGGALWKDVYSLLKGRDLRLMIIGGMCPTVGVGSFLLGGGLSAFSRKFGLGCDNVLEMIVVAAEGEIVTLSNKEADQKRKDMFWALCGGGIVAVAT